MEIAFLILHHFSFKEPLNKDFRDNKKESHLRRVPMLGNVKSREFPLDKNSPEELEKGIFPTAAERTEVKCSKTSGMSLELRPAIQIGGGMFILYVRPVSQPKPPSFQFSLSGECRPPGALKCPERPAGSLSPVSVTFSG